MRKDVVKIGKIGSMLGVLVGLIELSIGTEILSWIGNKENPAILGVITILLSMMAFVSVRSSDKHTNPTNDFKLMIFLGVFLPATICFTTVGRLWYLPGILLIVTSLSLAYDYWVCKSNTFSLKTCSSKLESTQIIGIIGSLIILSSVILAVKNSVFGLFDSNMLVNADQFRLEVLPMDIVRLTKISDSLITVENIEVQFVMIVYLLMMLGAGIALFASLVKSRIFIGLGGILVFGSLFLFLVCLPEILSQNHMPIGTFENIVGSFGIGWYTSILGMLLIIVASLIKTKGANRVHN